MKSHASDISYSVTYTNKHKERKTSGFKTLSHAESYFQEKIKMGYKPKLYCIKVSTTTELLKK